MKFLYTTDLHGRANNPISRLDDYPKTVLKKLNWVIDTANENGDFLLCGGDWLNRPDTSPSFIGDLAAALMRLDKKPCYTILGNHDLYGYNTNSFMRTPLYILERIGIICILDENNPVVISDENAIVALTGASASYDIDGEDKKHYIAKKVPNVDKHIHLTHGFLTDKPWPLVPHTLIKDILGTEADIVLSGHEHSGFGVVRKNNKLFCNPGSLLRVTAGIGDVGMTVRVFELDISREAVTDRFINCPETIALPSDIVLDRAKLLEEKAHEEKMLTFFSDLAAVDIDELDTTDVFTLFRAFAEKEEIGQDIQNEVIRRLAIASERNLREEVDGDEGASGTDPV